MSNLTLDETNKLRDRLAGLLPAQLEEAFSVCGMPVGLWPPRELPLIQRAIDFIRYLDQPANRPALDAVRRYLDRSTLTDPPPIGDPPPDLAKYLARRLDRKEQWSKLLSICDQPESRIVLLSGPRHADIKYFSERIMLDWPAERPRPSIVKVPLYENGVPLKTAADLEQRLQTNLATLLRVERGTTEGLLSQASNGRPVIVFLGTVPLDDFARQKVALKDFLKRRAPPLVASAHHPVVFFLQTYTDRKSDVEKLAQHKGGVPYETLPEIKGLKREDIEMCIRDSDLGRRGVHLTDGMAKDVIGMFNELISKDSSISLVELTHRLAERIQELLGH